MDSLSNEEIEGRYSSWMSPTTGSIEQFENERDAWRVHIAIFDGPVQTGRDTGMLWIEDGFLYFNGEHTSFALVANHLTWKSRFKRPFFGEVDDAFNRINLELNDKGIIGARSISIRKADSKALTWDTRQTIKEFLRSRSSDQLGQLPPVELGPGATNVPSLVTWGITTAASTLVFLLCARYWLSLLSLSVFGSQPTMLLVAAITIFSLLGMAWNVFSLFKVSAALRKIQRATNPREIGPRSNSNR